MSLVHDTPTVDVNIPRFNQAVVAVTIGFAFVVDAWWLIAVLGATLASAWLFGPKGNLTGRIYVGYLREFVDPGGPSEVEDARPPRFALLLGTLFTGAAAVALAVGLVAVGWTLAAVVGLLALLAATSRICVGCLIYERVKR